MRETNERSRSSRYPLYPRVFTFDSSDSVDDLRTKRHDTNSKIGRYCSQSRVGVDQTGGDLKLYEVTLRLRKFNRCLIQKKKKKVDLLKRAQSPRPRSLINPFSARFDQHALIRDKNDSRAISIRPSITP